jgi:hypothetical protein
MFFTKMTNIISNDYIYIKNNVTYFTTFGNFNMFIDLKNGK